MTFLLLGISRYPHKSMPVINNRHGMVRREHYFVSCPLLSVGRTRHLNYPAFFQFPIFFFKRIYLIFVRKEGKLDKNGKAHRWIIFFFSSVGCDGGLNGTNRRRLPVDFWWCACGCTRFSASRERPAAASKLSSTAESIFLNVSQVK